MVVVGKNLQRAKLSTGQSERGFLSITASVLNRKAAAIYANYSPTNTQKIIKMFLKSHFVQSDPKCVIIVFVAQSSLDTILKILNKTEKGQAYLKYTQTKSIQLVFKL